MSSATSNSTGDKTEGIRLLLDDLANSPLMDRHISPGTDLNQPAVPTLAYARSNCPASNPSSISVDATERSSPSPTTTTTTAADTSSVTTKLLTAPPAPICIPPPTLTARDINRVPTPLSARGDRKGHLFPFSRSPSPRAWRISKPKRARTFSNTSCETAESHARSRSYSPLSIGSAPSSGGMHNDLAFNRYPGSPLSPQISLQRPTSPSTSRRAGNHGRQSSQTSKPLGRYHPLKFAQADSLPPEIQLDQAPPPLQMDSPRIMKEKQKEFLEKTRLHQTLAASPLAPKPDQPRIDPLGSPGRGPVTPLALEERMDYFGRVSPRNIPGSKSPRSDSVSSDEDTKPITKARKLD